MKPAILFLPFLLALHSFAATVSGRVTGEKGEPLPFASISVKGTTRGAVANNAGYYSLTLAPGNYILVCQHVGYQSQEMPVTVREEGTGVNFDMKVQELKMAEVVIKRGEDPALAIMRKTVAKRDFYHRQTDSLTVDVYIKGLVRSRSIPDKVLGQKVDREEMKKSGIDSAGKGILFLSESLTTVAFKRPDRIRYEVVSSRESGGGLGFSFPFFVSFYAPNVQLFSGNVNPRGFVSPLADAAFHYYRFKFEGSFFEGGKMIDRIRVTPRRKNEPLFTGFLQIIDDEWRLHSLDLTVTRDYGLDLLDTIRITQLHTEVEKNAYKTSNQVVSVAAKFFGFDFTGDFLNVYSNYNLNPGFKKGFFNRILMKYDTAATRRDSTYWSRLRPVPLEPDEKQNFVFRDSVARADRDTAFSKATLDSLRKIRTPLKARQLVAGGYNRRFYFPKSTLTYALHPLLPANVQFNSVEGWVLKNVQTFAYRPRKGPYNLTIQSAARYGFSNRHLNAWGVLTLAAKTETFSNRDWQVTGGKQLLQFNRENPVDETLNSLYTLLWKRNWMKVYEAWTGKLTFNTRFESGLRLHVHAAYEDRIPVENTTAFSLFRKERSLLPNHPEELRTVSFRRHAAVVAGFTASFQPGQRYIQFPGYKMPVGSKYPTLELQYNKGIPKLFNSTADFDKWAFSVYDETNLQLLGTFKYRVGLGGFFNRRQVDIPDFTHFNGGLTFQNLNYLNSFQLAPYYRYSNTEKAYGLLHAEHHFNGLLTNKLPLFNRLKWNLVAGTNTFYVNRGTYYAELFAGVENILKVFRVDFIVAKQARPGNQFGVRMGLGGVLGGSIRRGGRQ